MIRGRSRRHFLFLALLGALFSPVVVSDAVTIERILATVDDQVVTLADYRVFAKELGGSSYDPGNIDEKVLRQLIEEKLIVREAKRRGLEASDGDVERAIEEFRSRHGLAESELEAALRDEGIDVETFRRMVRERILMTMLLGSEVDEKVLVTDKDIEEFYDSHRQDFLDSPERVELKAIYLLLREGSSVTEVTDLKRRALRIAASLRDGADFDELLYEHSDEPLRSHGGVLGTFARGSLIPPLDQKAFSMKEGEISEPIWVGRGVFILKLERRIPETFKPLEEVKTSIFDALYRGKRERIFNDWIASLWERSVIQFTRE